MKANFTDLTPLQVALIDAVYADAGNAPDSYASMVVDNYSWFSARCICKRTGWSKEKTAGVLSGAIDAGIVGDSGDGTGYDLYINDWVWVLFVDSVKAGLITQA